MYNKEAQLRYYRKKRQKRLEDAKNWYLKNKEKHRETARKSYRKLHIIDVPIIGEIKDEKVTYYKK